MKLILFILLSSLVLGCNSKIAITQKAANKITDTEFSALQWGQDFINQYGGSGAGDEYADTSIVDSEGNLYIAGNTTGNLVETAAGNGDIVISKYNSAGKRLWIKHIGVESAVPGGNAGQWESCSALAVDNNGYLYCAGSTSGSVGEANTNHRSDMLLIKLNANTGAVVMYKQWGAITGPPSGGINDTGLNDWFDDMKFYNGKLYFCASSSSYFAENSNGLYDIIGGRMDLNGNFEWITQIGNTTGANLGVNMTAREYGGKLAMDGTHLYCGGSTNGNFSEPTGGAYDLLFVKWNMSTGAVEGFKQIGATTMNNFLGYASAGDEGGCYDLEFDNNGDLICLTYSAGRFSDLDPGNSGDIVVLKLDTSFNPIWAAQLGTNTLASFGAGGSNAGWDNPNSIFINENNEIIVGGSTQSNLGEISGGSYDVFTARFSSAGALLDLIQYGSVTPLGDSDNSGYDGCSRLEEMAGKLYCLGHTAGAAFEANAGGSDLFIFPVDFP